MHPLGTEEKQDAEKHCQGNPYGGPDGGFTNLNNVVFLVEDTKVEGQHENDEDDENDEKDVAGNHVGKVFVVGYG